MYVLVVNCGSSTVKYQLFQMEEENGDDVLARGLVERIGIAGSNIEYKTARGEIIRERSIANHRVALEWIMETLTDPEIGVIHNALQINAIGHRVVHGGEKFTDSVLIDKGVLQVIRSCSELAPLHNPPNILGIEASQELIPGIPQVAVFDTAFHGGIPEYAYIYPIPYHFYEKHRIRRYGFHGTSHKYVAERAAKMIGRPLNELRLITCHMGGGVSFAAIKNGQSIDTSMGFTPLEGLVMGTRCGDIDPAIVLYLMEKERLSPKEMDGILNKQSGVLGVSGVSSDTRDIEDAAPSNHRAKLTLELIAYRAKKYIGAYTAILGGIDGVVLTAGIGENSSYIRKSLFMGLEHFGVEIDDEKNTIRRREGFIQTDSSRVKVMVIPTNEELMIAFDTFRLVKQRE
ncbi:MAG TPA: acetate kinase [Atribacteraceae bacterium]|nr:acetate kinase [Atribacteraceae bacterium]